MKTYEVKEQKQLELIKEELNKQYPAKRVNIVSLKLVKESSMLYKQRSIKSPEDVYNLFKQFIGDLDREAFVLVGLNTKNEPNHISICHIGSLNASLVHPREVMKSAILSNVATIVVGHNHPSGGNPDPSQEDIQVTRRLKEAGKLMGIDLLDHIIVGNEKYVSLKEKGYV